MNFYKHHLGDYAAATSHLSWDEDCAYRRLIDQYYKREAPIPTDVKEACRLSRATSTSHRRAVESVLREFFVLKDDGWHQKRCDVELVEAEEQGGDRSAKAENERERQRRHRAERKRLFEQLRELDIVPAWDTKTEALRAMLPQPHVTLSERDGSQHVTPDVTPVTLPVTCTATAIHKPLATSHKPVEDMGSARKRASRTRFPDDFAPNDSGLKAATDAGLNVQAELQRFRDHHEATGSLMASWQAAWRTWVGKAVEFGHGKPAKAVNGNTDWLVATGFPNIAEAQNCHCHIGNANLFRNGKRIGVEP